MSRRSWLVGAALLAAAVAVACSGDDDDADVVAAVATATPTATATQSPDTAVSVPAATPTAPNVDLSDITRPLSSDEARWIDRINHRYPGTDFSIRNVDLTEIVGVIPPDSIRAIREPSFVSLSAGSEWLDDQEPVIALEINGEARAYPLQIMVWHEIVIDTVGDVPVIVTFCPLCNTAITFDSRVNGELRTFVTSGALRRSDLIMLDLETESFWQQITGEAIVGTDTGQRLVFLPSQIVSWAEFRQTFPDATVLSRDTGYSRNYGSNPYPGYDRIGSSLLFRVKEFDDDRVHLKERVLAVEIDGDTVAFPFSELSMHVVLEAEVAGAPVVAFWQPDTLSALDKSFIVGSANVGSAGAFVPVVDGERLSFEARDGEIVDTQTGSVWNVLGRATSGPLEGTSLEPVIHANHFWFAWAVFKPDTRIIRAGAED